MSDDPTPSAPSRIAWRTSPCIRANSSGVGGRFARLIGVAERGQGHGRRQDHDDPARMAEDTHRHRVDRSLEEGACTRVTKRDASDRKGYLSRASTSCSLTHLWRTPPGVRMDIVQPLAPPCPSWRTPPGVRMDVVEPLAPVSCVAHASRRANGRR